MSALSAFGRFLWDFVVGDDWRAAGEIVLAIAATAAIASTSISAWWVLPLATVAVLHASLRRATRGGSR